MYFLSGFRIFNSPDPKSCGGLLFWKVLTLIPGACLNQRVENSVPLYGPSDTLEFPYVKVALIKGVGSRLPAQAVQYSDSW